MCFRVYHWIKLTILVQLSIKIWTRSPIEQKKKKKRLNLDQMLIKAQFQLVGPKGQTHGLTKSEPIKPT